MTSPEAGRAVTLPEWVWRRHENPKSGWSRVLGYWLLVWAVYRRDRRAVALAAGFLAVNPVLFPPPEREDAWMTRAVRAERAWVAAGRPGRLRGALNALTSAAFAYGLLAAYRRQHVRAAVATLAVTALKLAFVADLVCEYEPRREPQRRWSQTGVPRHPVAGRENRAGRS